MAQKTIDFENDILGPIGLLKEDLADLKDNKITKFYTNNNGDTVLNDSDDGKIQDLVIYGKSEQEQYTGKNLLNYEKWKTVNIENGTAVYENNGVTLTAIGMGNVDWKMVASASVLAGIVSILTSVAGIKEVQAE